MGKTVYLAGKLRDGEGSIAEFAGELEGRGHEVLAKWWEFPKLPTPYLDHPDTSGPAAVVMEQAAHDSQVTILFPTDNILGAMGEFSVALASRRSVPGKLVIAVNPFEVRQSVFYAHPAVIAVRGLSDVRSMSWY